MSNKTTTTNANETKSRTRKPRAAVKPAEVVENRDWQLTRTRPHVLAAVIRPIVFNPENKEHRAAYAHFLVNKKWPDHIRFIEEHPFTSAVTTAMQKMVEYALRHEILAVQAINKASRPAATKLSKEQK